MLAISKLNPSMESHRPRSVNRSCSKSSSMPWTSFASPLPSNHTSLTLPYKMMHRRNPASPTPFSAILVVPSSATTHRPSWAATGHASTAFRNSVRILPRMLTGPVATLNSCSIRSNTWSRWSAQLRSANPSMSKCIAPSNATSNRTFPAAGQRSRNDDVACS